MNFNRVDEEMWKQMCRDGYNFWCNEDTELREISQKINEKISDRARELHKEAIVIDACTFYMEEYEWRLEESGATAVCLTIPDCFVNEASHAMKRFADMHWVLNRAPDKMLKVEVAQDIVTAKKENKVGLIFGAQNPDFLDGLNYDGMVELFARIGLRVCQLSHDRRSFAAEGCMTGFDSGVTPEGRSLIKAMECAGVTVDLSHLAEKSCLDALSVCQKPVIASHTAPKALSISPCALSDRVIKGIADANGVVCCTFNPAILFDGKSFPDKEKFFDSICYLAERVGTNHIGIGTDTTAQEGAFDKLHARNLEKRYADAGSVYAFGYQHGFGKRSFYTEGLVSLANFPAVTDGLLERGFDEEEVKKILGGNLLRVFQQTWRTHRD